MELGHGGGNAHHEHFFPDSWHEAGNKSEVKHRCNTEESRIGREVGEYSWYTSISI